MPMTVTAIAGEGGAGPGRDPARGPEEGGIPGHAVAAVVGDPGQLPTAGPGRCLLVDTDRSHPAGPALVL